MSVRFHHRGHSNGPVLEGAGLVGAFLAIVVAAAWPLVVFAQLGQAAAIGIWLTWLVTCAGGLFAYGVVRHGRR